LVAAAIVGGKIFWYPYGVAQPRHNGKRLRGGALQRRTRWNCTRRPSMRQEKLKIWKLSPAAMDPLFTGFRLIFNA